MKKIILTNVIELSNIDPLVPVHIAVSEVSDGAMARLRSLSSVAEKHGLYQAVVNDSGFSYINTTGISEDESSVVRDLDALLQHEIVTDLNYMHVEAASFHHRCTERHAEISEMFGTPDIPLDVLNSTADVVVIKSLDDGDVSVRHFSANEFTFGDLYELSN